MLNEPPDHHENRPSPAAGSQARLTATIVAAALVLAGLDLARPYVGTGLRPWQWLTALALIGLVAARRRAAGFALAPAAPAFVLALFLVPTFVDHTRALGNGDGMHYYSYLHSVLFDGDLDLRNDYRLIGWHDPDAPNVLPVGAPILWAPAIVAVHLGRTALRAFGWPAPLGMEPVYPATVCLTTLVLGAAALFLLWAFLCRFVPPWVALWATVLCWIGSPLRFYLSVLPALAHGSEFFGAVLALLALFRLREGMDARRAFAAGAACGLTFLARSQDGMLLALPAAEIAWQATVRREGRRGLACGAALAGGFLLVALPQLVVWQLMFGTPLLIPHQRLHGADFLHTRDPQLLGALFSPRGGLFLTHPMMLVAVIGLLVFARRERRYVVMLVPVLLAMWFLNASVFDWYQVRRFTGLVPFVAPALAVVLVPLARGRMVLLALLAFLALRYDLAVDARRSEPGDPVPLRAAVAEMGDMFARDVYAGLERVSARLAVAFVKTTGAPALLEEDVSRLDLSQDLRLLRVPLPARHLSEAEVEQGVACRWVTDREARLFLPLARSGALDVVVRARPLETDEPQTMEVVWNDTALGPRPMATEWSEYTFAIPPEAVHVGTNVFVVRFARAPVFHRVRGYGPRETRAAALASIELRRR